ncbi:MAG TPA: hypothetical protein VIH02_08090 [Flavobacterium sp.]
MKKITLLTAIIALTFSSCATKMIKKSPAEVKIMSTKQYETSKALVFKSIISLLQSESYLIDQTDKETGLIRASMRIENRNATLQKMLLDYSKDATIFKVAFYIEDINPSLSEVKITIYKGVISSGYGKQGHLYGNNSENMVYDVRVYNDWFNKLRAEIERRKALTY